MLRLFFCRNSAQGDGLTCGMRILCSPSTARLWGRLLLDVPDTRLKIKACLLRTHILLPVQDRKRGLLLAASSSNSVTTARTHMKTGQECRQVLHQPRQLCTICRPLCFHCPRSRRPGPQLQIQGAFPHLFLPFWPPRCRAGKAASWVLPNTPVLC